MSLDFVLLGLMRSPRAGYDLKRAFSADLSPFWSAELSQVYPALKRLERKGWLASAMSPSEQGPERRVYRITVFGRRALRDWLLAEPRLGTERSSYLAQLYFMDELAGMDEGVDSERVLGFLRTLREGFLHRLEHLRVLEGSIVQGAEGIARAMDAAPPASSLPRADFHHLLTVRAALHATAARIAWCEETEAWIRAHPPLA